MHLLTCFLFLQLVPSVSLPEKRKTAKQVKEERHTVTQELKIEKQSQRMDHCLLEPEQMESGIRLGVTQAQEGSY